MIDLTGKNVFITGGGSGIGKGISDVFARAGANVVVADINIDSARLASEQLKGIGKFSYTHIDVTDKESVSKAVESAINSHNTIDILINNAGLASPGNIEDTTDTMWEQLMDVNLNAMFKLSRELLPLIKLSKSGRIINLGSIMSDMAGNNLCAYGTTKHAVAGLSKSMSVDLGKYGITVNYLQPGAIVTALSKPFFDDPEFKQYWENKAPIGRLGQPEDVAHAAMFLASEQSSFITGVGLNVDGGAIVMF